MAVEQYILELEARVTRMEHENKRLQKSEEKFNKAFYKNQVPMIITRVRDGLILDVNDRYLKLLEYKHEDFIGKSVLDIGLWDDITAREELVTIINKEGCVKNFKARFRTESGRIGISLSSISVLELEGEVCFLVSSEDITEREKAEEELRLSEEKFSKSFHESGAMKGIARCRDGVLIDVNESYASAFGFGREEMIGKTVSELDIWADPSEGLRMREKLREEGAIRNWEYNYKTKSGEIGSVVTNVDLINIKGEECILVSSNDITTRKRAEQDLVRVQKLLYQVFDSIPHSMIIISRADGKIVEANQEFLKTNGLSRKQAIGQKYIFQNYVENPEVINECFETFQRDGYLVNCEASLNSIARGEMQTVLINAIAIDWAGQDCALVLSNNVTELRRYQNELSRLDKLNLMGQMAGSIAHEVRNPMTAIKGFLQMFHEQYKYREDRESIELMIEELDRVNEIISQFLSLAQKNILDLKLFSLNQNIKNVLPLIMADAIKNDVYIQTDLVKIPKVMLDKGEFRQLLLNLAHNGIQAMSKGGTLTIKTFRDDDGVHLVVHDEGKGIPPEIMDKIGTPFVTTKKEGTGLGLAVCYSIAERHNAKITVDTGSAGTSFKVSFPVIC